MEEDDSQCLQAVRAIHKDNLDAPPSSAPGTIIRLETYKDPETKSHLFSGVILSKHLRILVPKRIAAFPDAILDVVVKDPVPSTGVATSKSPVLETPPATPQKDEKPAIPASTIRRNPVGGLVEEAMQNYNHMVNPSTAPRLRGPQKIPDEKLPPSSIKPTTPDSVSAGNSDLTETVMNARHGDAHAQVALRDLCRLGQGVQQSYQKAIDWYLKAADQGDPVGQRRVGALYNHGLGVKKNSQTAMVWFLKAVDQGDAASQRNIGVLYHCSHGIARDDSKAMEWYSKAAEQGDAAAQYALGLMYHIGQGIPPDVSQTLGWYVKATEQGHGQAQCNLGFLYGNDESVTQDCNTALDWYLKAASQNHVVAMCNIARYYNRGRCSLQQSTMATEGLKRAAEKGDPDATRYLQELQRHIQTEQ
ncbi:hypothetical protein BGZ96_011870 [Linnemannia gamsii]|uniref:HCP-like protein n=1 Tax=Linnemannia gamsii TaxID=64522 RepID=A0ABQ7JRJ0_9FUNG|nr:hypothetical protein BGZ96_011870 [Linnemannia gamsii]